jgi:hypothetical protein
MLFQTLLELRVPTNTTYISQTVKSSDMEESITPRAQRIEAALFQVANKISASSGSGRLVSIRVQLFSCSEPGAFPLVHEPILPFAQLLGEEDSVLKPMGTLGVCSMVVTDRPLHSFVMHGYQGQLANKWS